MARGGAGTTAAALWRETGSWPVAERLHLQARYRTAPWRRILDAIAPEADTLDVGCGPGLLAWLLERRGFAARYVGLDPDPRKVGRARRWPLDPARFTFREGGISGAGGGAFVQVAVVDVLYLVPPAHRAEFIADVARSLSPGGRAVFVSSGGGPAWKRRLDLAQERAAVALGLTRGEALGVCDGDETARLAVAAGLGEAAIVDLGEGYVHGFELVTAVAPRGN